MSRVLAVVDLVAMSGGGVIKRAVSGFDAYGLLMSWERQGMASLTATPGPAEVAPKEIAIVAWRCPCARSCSGNPLPAAPVARADSGFPRAGADIARPRHECLVPMLAAGRSWSAVTGMVDGRDAQNDGAKK